VKAISLRQPWAWLVVAADGYQNPKRVENRNWMPSYRGPLLIHAARTVELDAAAAIVKRRPDLANIELPATWEQEGMRGGIVGVAYLVTVNVPSANEWYDRRYRFGWHLEHAYPLPFAPWLGLPGLFDIDENLLPENTRTALDMWTARVGGRH
jgi:hypothetical protein